MRKADYEKEYDSTRLCRSPTPSMNGGDLPPLTRTGLLFK